MDYEALKKLLPLLEKELPAVDSAGRTVGPAADALISKDASIIGQGTSVASPKDLPIQDADILTQQSPQGPNQAALPAPDIASKWQQLKDIAPYAAGTAVAGTAAGLMSGDGGSGNNTAQAASAPAAAQSVKPDSSDDDSDDQDDNSSPSAPKAQSAKPAADDDSDDEDEDEDNKPSTPDLSNPNISSLDKLRQLQQRQQQQLALNDAGRNMAATTYAMAGKANPFDKQFEDNAKQSGLGVDQYLQQTDFQKQDPNSPVSKAYRDLAKSIYPDMPIGSNLSAADLEKVNPELGNIRTREDMISMKADAAQDRNDEQHYRNQMLAMQMQDRETQRQAAAEQKQGQLDSKRMDTFAAKMALPSSRTVLGQAQNQIFSVNRVDALLNGHGNLNNLTPQEMMEVAKGLDRVISGGASTLEGSKTLNPDTAKQWIATQLQKISNVPQGAGGGAFLSRIQGNLQNEKNTAIQQAARQYQTLLAGSGDLAKRNPEAFGDFLDKSGVDPEVKEYLLNGKKPTTIQEQQKMLNSNGVNGALAKMAPSTAQPGAQTTTSSAPPPANDMISVKTSDGKIWNIPKSRLDDAKARDPNLVVQQ